MSRRRTRLKFYRALAFMLLFGCAVAGMRKYGWLPFEFGNTEMGRLDDIDVDLTNFDPAIDESEFAGPSGDSEVFLGQREPIVESGTSADSRPSDGSLHSWLNPNSDHPGSRSDDFADRPADWPIRQVSNEARSKKQEVASPRVAKRQSAPSAASPDVRTLLREVDGLLESGKDVAAHRQLSQIYWKHPNARPHIQKKIEVTARLIYFSPQPHYMEPYVIQPGDQLRTIARLYRITWPYLAKMNRIDPRRIRAGQKLKVIKGPFAAFIDLSDHELIIHAHGYYVKKYSVGIGKDGSSPVGRLRVVNKVTNPQYTDPQGRVIDADDPNNPLGEHWIDIGDGFGIHGTINPDSIGGNHSRGCIRLLNTDVAEVYDFLDFDSEVIIRR